MIKQSHLSAAVGIMNENVAVVNLHAGVMRDLFPGIGRG